MGQDLLLSVDVGTQSVRAMLFNGDGELLHRVKVVIQPYVSPHPGWAEQDPKFYWERVGDACRRIWTESEYTPKQVAGVAITSQRATVVNVDNRGEPLRPAMLWADQRRTEGLPPVGGLWGLAFRIAGMTETVAYLQAEAEANWIRTHQPEIWEATHKYLFLSGYLTFCFTGRFVDSAACQVGYMPFDYKHFTWAKSWDWKWRALPMDKQKLPDLVMPGEILGHVTEEAAEHTGIPKGTPVVAAAADKACEVLGCGCIEPSVANVSYGTTATINLTSNKYIEPIPLIPPYPSAIPGAYNLEIQIYRGFWMVPWVLREFGEADVERARREGVAPEVVFDRMVAETPRGSMGLVLQPYWAPGLRVPGPEAKGAVIGFGDVHGRAHLYRAVLEGLAYALREGKERLTQRTRSEVRELRVSGGGSQSDQAMQITADVFNLPAARPHVHETSGLGAAIVASVGLGIHPDISSAVSRMTRISRVFEPDPEGVSIYEQIYQRVYRKVYAKIRPIYNAIRDITGYPPVYGRKG